MGQFGENCAESGKPAALRLKPSRTRPRSAAATSDALEQEQFDRLPGGVFNRGIVRGYARVVGLDEDTWVDRFMSAYQASGMVIPDDADWVQIR